MSALPTMAPVVMMWTSAPPPRTIADNSVNVIMLFSVMEPLVTHAHANQDTPVTVSSVETRTSVVMKISAEMAVHVKISMARMNAHAKRAG
jgi:hypothetical protein